MKKPIALFLTDTHATPNNIELQEDIWYQAIHISKTKGIDTIYHGGDWVTARKAQTLEVLKHLDWIKELVCDCNDMGLIGISGNHDKTFQESQYAYPNILSDENFFIADEHYVREYDNINIHFMPYFTETGSYKDRIDDIRVDGDKKSILITHISVNGGLAHENATANKEVPADLFDSFDKVLIGHFHNRNKVDYKKTDIWYTGSAFASNYGEDNEKGFTIIYDDGSIEFINSEFPKYETISIEADKVDGNWLSETKRHIKETENNVRLIISGDESELKSIQKKKFSDIGIKKLQLNSESVAIRNKDNEVVFVNLDKDTVKKEYKRFCVNQEIDSELGLEYLNL